MDGALEGARLLTLVFTDLVGSTKLKIDRGDRIAGELITRHRCQVDQLREECGGRVVDWAGDGCFLTFEVPSAAAAFSLRLQQVHAGDSELPKVRVGIHVGEVTESFALGGVLHVEGLAVDLAARIQSLALPGQVLMSSGVFNSARQRLGSEEVGASIAWRAHGPYQVQGFDNPIEVCEAGLEGLSPLAAPPGSEKAYRVATPVEEETLGWRPAVGLAVPGRGHWRLQRQLGEGGFGEVWLAVHEKTREKRVFKFCFELERVRGLKREVVLFRLLKEALGARDDIARVLDWQFERPPYFLEAEYTEGGDLKAWAEAQGGLDVVPLAVRLDIVAQTAEALGAAHSVGVLHKDIKPDNILIVHGKGLQPLVRLTDFGIGLITNPEALQVQGITVTGLTQTLAASGSSSGSGTRLYMAPELVEGKPPTTLSDIYALGVVLYQMAIADFGRTVAPGWERDIEDDLLRGDIALCVDGRPEKRVQSANEVGERLRDLDERRAQEEARRKLFAEAEEARRLAEISRRRRRYVLAFFSLGVVLTLATALFAIREYRRAEEQARLHVQAAVARQDAESGRYLADIQLAAARLDQGYRLTARRALLDTPPRFRNWEWGYLVGQAWAAPPEPAPQAFRSWAPGTPMAEVWADSEGYMERELVGHGAFVSGISFSPDGACIATSSGDGAARLWDAQTGALLKVLQADRRPLYDVAFNAEGTRLGTAGWTGSVSVWDVSTGNTILVLRPEGGPPARKIEFSVQGSRLLTIHYDKTACLWDTSDGRLLATYVGSEGEILSGRVSDDLIQVVTSGADGKVRTWDAQTGRLLDAKTGPAAGSQIIDPKLRTVAEVLADRVVLWNRSTQKPLYSLEVQPLDFGTAYFSKDGSCILVACLDRMMRLWDVATGRLLTTLENTTGGTFFCATCSDDGSRIAIGSEDGIVTIWRPIRKGAGGREGRVLHGHDGAPSHAWFSPDGSRIVTSAYDGTVKVWDTETLRDVSVFHGHAAAILHSVFSRDGKRIHSLSVDGVLKVWDAETGRELWSMVANPAALRHSIERVGGMQSNIILDAGALIRGDCESPDGHCSLVFTDGEALLVDAQTGQKLVALEGCRGSTDAISFSPDGSRVTVSGHGRNDTGVWDTETGRRLCSLVGHQADVTTAKFSPDGRSVLTASADGTARIWDAATSRERSLLPCGGALFTARFSPDGMHVVTASLDCTATIFDASTGQREAVLAGHSAFVLDASFSPDGTRILTLSSDHTVKVWDIQGHDLLTLAPGKRIATAEWSPDGPRVLTAHTDGTARLWEAAPWEEIGVTDDGTVSFEERLKNWRARQARQITPNAQE
jgi:WD40 repeat protein/class 3 adenylate cyclase/tRNA A-37 threonylcarbamoyl transferase component Bud32